LTRSASWLWCRFSWSWFFMSLNMRLESSKKFLVCLFWLYLVQQCIHKESSLCSSWGGFDTWRLIFCLLMRAFSEPMFKRRNSFSRLGCLWSDGKCTFTNCCGLGWQTLFPLATHARCRLLLISVHEFGHLFNTWV
jgi:hypothetical protein